jgi:hypothetical protein
MDSHEIEISELITDEQINAFLLSFADLQEREEALVLTEWLRTKDLQRFLPADAVASVKRGDNPPDFVISANTKIAIEVTTFITGRKAIYEKAARLTGAYTSTLRNDKPDAAFHAALRNHTLPDDSAIFPHFEVTADLDRDYYKTMEAVLSEKIAAVKHYSSLYNHTVILVEDCLSEFERVLDRRLPRLRSFIRLKQPPASVEIVLINVGTRPAVAHRCC